MSRDRRARNALQSLSRVAAARSGTFWAIAGLTALAAAIRFATVGLQAYHHDEAITVVKILHPGLRATLSSVRDFESTPPLYYGLAWGWSQIFGVHEAGLRSLSALAGVATVPLAGLIGIEAAGRRVGVALAALVAVNPMLIWYSQEARAYSLLVLLSAVSLLFFLRFRRSGANRDLAWWSVSSALALATHYFAGFLIVIEAGVLLLDRPARRRILIALAPIAATVLGLAPLATSQAGNSRHTTWIAGSSAAYRAWETAVGFTIGETGRFIGQKPAWTFAVVPLILVGAGLLLASRAQGRERRGAAIGLLLGGGALAIVIVLAAAGKDYLLDRNLLPILIPIALVAAIGFRATRTRALGAGLAALLVVYWLAFDVYVDFRPNLQRPNWRTVAAKLGPLKGSRAIVTWKLADYPLVFYLDRDLLGVTKGTPPQRVNEVDVIFRHPPPAKRPSRLPAPFREVERDHFGDLTLIRYRSPRVIPISRRELEHFRTGFPSNGAFVEGPAAEAQFGITGSTIRARP
jgi:mannosyltransferase